MEDVPLIDAAGAMILRKFFRTACARRMRVVLCGVRPAPQRVLKATQVDILASNFDAALAMARTLAA
jgi:anti-anti-sigma regulatory factor